MLYDQTAEAPRDCPWDQEPREDQNQSPSSENQPELISEKTRMHRDHGQPEARAPPKSIGVCGKAQAESGGI